MNLSLLLVSVSLLGAGGVGALLCSRWPRLASGVGAGTAATGCGLGLIAALRALGDGPSTLRWPWSVPLGEFAIGLDELSAFFLIAVFLLSGLAGVYGVEYLKPYAPRKSLGPPWCFFNLLIVGMVLVIVARNAVLFLVAWEIMSLASYFLVTFEHEEEHVGQAGWTYLVATHLGTAFLLAMFALLSGGKTGLDFGDFAAGGFTPARAGLIFVLAVVGFGTKAGFMPFHVWLPEAHPAAPSHVSAVMSGVMIKTGIYGLVRTLIFLGPPPAWWGWLLIAIGVVSGVVGVLYALAQHDLKRLLAYSSVENIGIIAVGLGTGLLGLSLQSTPMTVLGFGGGLLHVLNHACFKGLLFLGAGAVVHGTGTREMDRLGGLLKRMPWTGWAFLVGATAISGLPPLNGFVGELLIYVGAFEGVRSAPVTRLAVLVSVVAGLALIGGLAMACFAKAFGAVFQGEPRTQTAEQAHECGWWMRGPMLGLAGCCVLIGLLGPVVVRAMAPAIGLVARMPTDDVRAAMTGPSDVLWTVVGVGTIFVLLVVGLWFARRRLMVGRTVTQTGTWDCGYARPTARMEYTGSSFTQPLVVFFQLILRTRTALVPPSDYFPAAAALRTQTDDLCREKAYGPVFRCVAWLLSQLRWLQHGRVQIYVLYIALTLLALLLWKLE